MVKMERQYLKDTIDKEGLHYAMLDYSDYEDIEDAEFHKLRKAYIEAAKALEDYVG